MSWTNEGYVKRSDLRLRTAYPFLQTRIYEVSPLSFAIQFDGQLLVAASIEEEFNYKMRFVTANVHLTNDVPENFVREVQPILDDSIASECQGMPFTRFDLFNIISSKFPEFDLAQVSDVRDGVNYIIAKSQPSEQCLREVSSFCTGLLSSDMKVIVDGSVEIQQPSAPEDVLRIVAHKLRPNAPSFVRQDEEFWFSNIERIYSGHVRPHIAPAMRDAGPACYIDFSLGASQASLRQALLMYDTIYITPPIWESQEFWQQQKFSEEDFLTLVEMGRVRFLLAQPEERCDMRLLKAAFERKNSAIIGRREASAILLGDLVQTAREYKLRDANTTAGMLAFADFVGQQIQVPREEIVEFLMWPQIALRKSFDFFLDRGVMGAAPVGPGALFGKQLHRLSSKDLELEALILGQQAYVAHALNATYIAPPSQSDGWNWIVKQVGDRLNFYRSYNDRIVAAWTGNERRKEEKRLIMPSVPIFEFDSDTTLSEINKATATSSTRRKGRALIGRLIDLPVEERSVEISRLARQLRGLKAERTGLISLESLEDAGPLIEALGAHAAPPIFATKNLLARILHIGRRHPKVDYVVDAIEQDLNLPFGKSEDLDFLSKVDRVATLKRDRVE